MKKVLIVTLLSIWAWIRPTNSFAQDQEYLNKFNSDFNSISIIFDKNLEPYLQSFSQNLTSPKLDSCDRVRYPKSVYNVLRLKVDMVNKDLYKILLEAVTQKKSNYSLEEILARFSHTYLMEITGLDYHYFEKCEREVKLLADKK